MAYALATEFHRYWLNAGERRSPLRDIFLVPTRCVGTQYWRAAPRITAVQDKKTAKDFVDLYFLQQKLRLEQLVNDAQKKIVPKICCWPFSIIILKEQAL
jgi:hypothetical protein